MGCEKKESGNLCKEAQDAKEKGSLLGALAGAVLGFAVAGPGGAVAGGAAGYVVGGDVGRESARNKKNCSCK